MTAETRAAEDAYLPPLSGEVRDTTRKVLECAARGKKVPSGWDSALVEAWRALAKGAAGHVKVLFPAERWIVREAPGQTHRWNVFVFGDDGVADTKRFIACFAEESVALRFVADHNMPLGDISGLLGQVKKILEREGGANWP